MDVYHKLLVLARRYKDLRITFCSIQHGSKQTAIVLESLDEKIEPFMINIDETQKESMQELIRVCNMIAKNLNPEKEDDDQMDVVEANANKIESFYSINTHERTD